MRGRPRGIGPSAGPWETGVTRRGGGERRQHGVIFRLAAPLKGFGARYWPLEEWRAVQRALSVCVCVCACMKEMCICLCVCESDCTPQLVLQSSKTFSLFTMNSTNVHHRLGSSVVLWSF